MYIHIYIYIFFFTKNILNDLYQFKKDRTIEIKKNKNKNKKRLYQYNKIYFSN